MNTKQIISLLALIGALVGFGMLVTASFQLLGAEEEKTNRLQDLQQAQDPENHFLNLAYWKSSIQTHLPLLMDKHWFSKETMFDIGRMGTRGALEWKNNNDGLFWLAEGASWISGDDDGDALVEDLMSTIIRRTYLDQRMLDPPLTQALLTATDDLIEVSSRQMPDKSRQLFKKTGAFDQITTRVLGGYRRLLYGDKMKPWMEEYPFTAARLSYHGLLVRQAVEYLQDKVYKQDKTIKQLQSKCIWSLVAIFLCCWLFLWQAPKKRLGAYILIGTSLLLLGFVYFLPLFHIHMGIDRLRISLLFDWDTHYIGLFAIQKSLAEIIGLLSAAPGIESIIVMIAALFFLILLPVAENITLLTICSHPNRVKSWMWTFVSLGIFAFVDVIVIVSLLTFVGDQQLAALFVDGAQQASNSKSFLDITPYSTSVVRSGLYFVLFHYFFSLAKKGVILLHMLWHWSKLYINIRRPLREIVKELQQTVQKKRSRHGVIDPIPGDIVLVVNIHQDIDKILSQAEIQVLERRNTLHNRSS